TEVIAHLIAHCLREEIEMGSPPGDTNTCIRAVEAALTQLKGTYGLAVLFREAPQLLIAARLGSPLVIGVGQGEYFLASDASPLVGRTEEVVYLSDHELAVLTPDDLHILHRDDGEQTPSIRLL